MEFQSMKRIKRDKFLILVFFICLYLLPLGARDLIVPDETRYAEIPREMIAGGDWVVPRLDGVRYFEKPAMGYWVYAAAMLLFGQNNFAVRLPSALAVGLSAILIFLLAARATNKEETPNHGIAALATIIFLTCFEVFGVGNTAVLDNLFALFLTTAVMAFFTATEKPPGTAGEKGWLLLAGASTSLAFLTKGFLAFALPVIVFVPFLVWQRRIRDIWRMGWLPMMAAILVALPWSVAIGLREPDFWRFFFWNEHIRRFMGVAAQHQEPLWYFFMLAPAMFLPWTFLVPAAVKGLRGSLSTGKRQRHLIRLCICWLVVPFVFFSLSKGKLITYILPCFPPFAILMAFGLTRAVRKARERPTQWGIAGTGILFALVLAAFIWVQLLGYQGFRPFSHPWKALMAVNGLFFMILLCFLAFKSQMNVKKIILFGLSPLLLFFVGHFTMPDQTMVAKAPGRFLERYRAGIGPDSLVISDEDSVRASCWYLKRGDLYVVGGTGELDYGMAYPDTLNRSISLDALSDMIGQYRGKLVLIARSENIERWKSLLPKPIFMDSSGAGGYAIWKY
jgi:4-amino-4-deoxy-L-arabinose transferase